MRRKGGEHRMIKVSVIVPIYNAGKKLENCIKSVLSQTIKDFELILVNDGSTDNSLNICRKYENLDNRIIVINKINEGSIATRRKGLEAAGSDYVMFVDADDWIDKKAIEILYKESTENLVDITVCNMYRVTGNGNFIKQRNNSEYFNQDRIYNKEEIRRDLVTAYFHGHPFPSSLCAKLYKKELLLNSGKYLNRIRFLGEDLFYNLEVFITANKVKVIDKALYYYKVGGFTGKYMPYLFDDMVNGYQILKEVIDEYYQDTQQKRYNGISVMLLNTYKTCLYNLFISKLNESQIKDQIRAYTSNDMVVDCIDNEGAQRNFSVEYLNAIRHKDLDYLYKLGQKLYRYRRSKRIVVNILTKLSFV
jgi:glycosyltransferase involved in cell wall biosynthesis